MEGPLFWNTMNRERLQACNTPAFCIFGFLKFCDNLRSAVDPFHHSSFGGESQLVYMCTRVCAGYFPCMDEIYINVGMTCNC